MSEIKRVAFTTISSSVSGGSTSAAGSTSGNAVPSTAAAVAAISSTTSAAALHRFGAPDPVTSHKSSISGGNTAGGGGGISKPAKTIRLNMELFASNSNSFPEFNYSKLIHLEKKKMKKLKNKQNGFSDPFEENDDDVARIAKELEQKYGTTYASGRGSSKKDDFCDIGLGYDESDSFIDNTEAYDEIIPEEVETVEGGFYINSGALVFKHLSSTEKTDEIIKMPNRPKKRALSTSSEESGSSEEEGNDNSTDAATATTTAAIATVNNPSANAKVSTSSSKQKTALQTEKRHKTSSDKESSDKEKSSKSKSSTATTSAASSVTVSASASPKDDDIGSEASSKDKVRVERTVKTTTVKDMLKAKRDSFLKMQEEEQKTKTSNGEIKGSNSVEDVSGSDSSSDDSDSNDGPSAKKLKKTTEEDSDKLRQFDSKLPDLKDNVYRDIQDMKDTAKTSNRTGKKFQFDEKLTEVFLRIDESCSCVDKNVRNAIFAHLEYQLLLPKYFLLRKAKQLRINQEKTKTKKALVKLRKAVAEVMPAITQQYQLSVRTYEEFLSMNTGIDVHKMENAPKFPKKRFAWNDIIRTLLYDVYQVRWMSYTVLRTRKESFEDFVGNFLKEKVMNIWPSGWIKYEELKREIEKKKNVPKKLKENKKPEESLDALCSVDKSHLLKQDAAMNSGSKLPLNATDLYAMSSSSELISSNLAPNDVAKLLPAHSNASSEHLHSSKTYSSSAKAHRSSTSSPLNLCSGQSQQASGKGEKSSSGCATNNNNNANPNQNLNSNRTSGNVNICKNVVDLVSPSKRTDHSINSIMSSPSSTSSSVSTTPQPQHSTGMGNTLLVDNNTHVINIDNFKSATEIINTSNQLIHHTNKPQSTERLKNRPTATDLHLHAHNQFKTEPSRRDSSSESDGVEIVGVYQARNPVSSLPLISKNKYKKSNHQDSRSDSPGTNDKIKSAPVTAASKKSIDNSDLDVNKIMKALKELEELQQTGNYVPDITSVASSNHNANTSPLAYGKDLTQ